MTATERRVSDDKISSIDTKVDVLANNMEVHQEYNRESAAEMRGMMKTFIDKFDALQNRVVAVIERQEFQQEKLIHLIEKTSNQDERITQLQADVIQNTSLRVNFNGIVWKIMGTIMVAGAGAVFYAKEAKADAGINSSSRLQYSHAVMPHKDQRVRSQK